MARQRAVRVRDAATLVLVRREEGEPRILMGRRHGGHRFMPNKFVFPGGRVDPVDGRIRPLAELRPDVESRLTKGYARCSFTPSGTELRSLARSVRRRSTRKTVGRPLSHRRAGKPRIRPRGRTGSTQ